MPKSGGTCQRSFGQGSGFVDRLYILHRGLTLSVHDLTLAAPETAAASGGDITRVTLSLDAVKAGGFASVVVTDNQGRRAWTNPVRW